MKTPTVFLALALATSLGGCASLTGGSAPSCDGSARRPLNRSLWEWESAKTISGAPIAAPPMETPAPPPVPPSSGGEPLIRKGEIGRAQPVARAKPAFDIAASTRRCGGADHG
jgi:type IV secretion system protein VirB7